MEENINPQLKNLFSNLEEVPKTLKENLEPETGRFELRTLVVVSASALAAISTLAVVFGLGTVCCLWLKKQPLLRVRGTAPVV
jgi:hypothetical protein